MKGLLAILTLIAVAGAISAQDTTAYAKWKEQHRQQLQSFKDSVSDDYKAFLEQNWREYDLLKSEHRKGLGKPIDQPQVDSSDIQLPEEIKSQPMQDTTFTINNATLNRSYNENMQRSVYPEDDILEGILNDMEW